MVDPIIRTKKQIIKSTDCCLSVCVGDPVLTLQALTVQRALHTKPVSEEGGEFQS